MNDKKKIFNFSISRLPLIMLILYATGYIMRVVYPDIIGFISLNPERILNGEIWRIVTWLMIPPTNANLFFLLITLYFYYVIGTVVERAWGSKFFTAYFLGGILCSIIGIFIYYFIIESGSDTQIINKKMYDLLRVLSSGEATYAPDDILPYLQRGDFFWNFISNYYVSTYYINLSVFLAYAATYPDNSVYLLFFPIKVRALGIIYIIYYMVVMIESGRVGVFTIGASFINFAIFYFFIKKRFHRSFKQTINAAKFKRAMNMGTSSTSTSNTRVKITKHKCAICGQSEENNPELTFRFCSKCKGNYEYCQEHLFTHKHVE